MSDNWNLLAKLLGTPGPPEPRKTPEPKEPPQQVPDDHAGGASADSSQSGSSQSGSDQSAAREMPPVAEAVSDVRADSIAADDDVSAEDVLQALTAETAVTRLPGFGTRPSDPLIEDLTAGAPPLVEEPIAAQLLQREKSVSESDRLFAGESTRVEAAAVDPAPVDTAPVDDVEI
ncbi:MAG: hypothetical protein KDB00_02665, partial [Planctomycetales bacterium]|nr:hypothetical protein [Planctomycetales bacterium]